MDNNGNEVVEDRRHLNRYKGILIPRWHRLVSAKPNNVPIHRYTAAQPAGDNGEEGDEGEEEEEEEEEEEAGEAIQYDSFD